MMQDIIKLCQDNPQIVVFLALALGYAVGRIKFKGFTLGPTTGVLLSALVLGQVNIQVPGILKAISFALFTFCIGYRVGPQFFGALKKEGIRYVCMALVVAFTGLGTAVFLGKVFHFDKGTTAGFFAGSMTQSMAIGTAEGAISHLSISEADKAKLDTNVAVSYAITYIFGTAGILIFFKLIPKILRIDFREEARKLQEQMSGGSSAAEESGLFSWAQQPGLRAYQVSSQNIIGKKISEVENMFPTRVAIDKIKRGGQVLATSPDTVLQPGDILALMAPNRSFINAHEIIGPEILDKLVTDIVGEVLKVCVLSPEVVGKKLGELDVPKAHGVFLRRVTRQGHEVPLTKETEVHKCDVFHIIGGKVDIERVAKHLGYAERPTGATDLIMVGIGCVIGALVGMLAIKIAGIPITLGMGGGVLVTGLIFGWLRSARPTFGQIPTGAQWLLMNLGLNLFVACIGLSAGPQALQALQAEGLTVFYAGVILALVPVIVGLLFGKFVLKMNPVLLMGALAGARVLTAALNMLQEDAGNSTPLLAYAAPYAFGNVLLAIWGSVIVNIM